MNSFILQIVNDSIATLAEKGSSTNIWMWIAIIEILVIISLLLNKKKYRNQRYKTKSEIKNEGEIDFDNTMMSAFHAKELYDELKVKCHPDRFVTDEAKHLIADDLISQIAENKNNYKRLCELKLQAQIKLGIK